MYSLCALLGPADLLKGRLAGGSARVIGLEGGIGMVPLSESLLRDVQRHHLQRMETAPSPPAEWPFEFMSAGLESWVRALSKGARVVYVETEYYGGEGFERAALWSEGEVVLGPLDGAGAVNQALRALGVAPKPGQEEFDYVGLGRHRSLEEWLSEA